MRQESPFSDPGPGVRELLAREFEGPDGSSFMDRLSARLRSLPARDSQWDVLAAWARPSVLIAAMAAGLLLGLTLWQNWRDRTAVVAAPAVSVAMLEEPRPIARSIVYTVMGER
jgi:hypothetical protein